MRKAESGLYKKMIGVLAGGSLLAMLPFMTGCGNAEEDEIVLRVANWEEYMDEGDWDEEDAIEFGDGTVL